MSLQVACTVRGVAGSLSRLIYVDDSGDPKRGWIVYAWVEVSPAGWRLALREWLELRKELWRDYSIPPAMELHTTNYANGRDRISKDPPSRFVHSGIVHWKDLGREVAERCLEVLRDCTHITVGAVWEHTSLRGSEYAIERGRVYSELVQRWDREHRRSRPMRTFTGTTATSSRGIGTRTSSPRRTPNTSLGTWGVKQQGPRVHECGGSLRHPLYYKTAFCEIESIVSTP